MTRSRGRDRGGFTLIEVLLVLVILVVLASLATVNILSAQRTAKISAAQSQIGLFRSPLEMYQLAIGSYPTSAQGLYALVQPPPDLPMPDKWQGPYLDKGIPPDPWGNPYQYSYPGQNNPMSYDIWTVSPEGQTIGNW